MDCATLCFISATLAFTPSSDVQKCMYCLDVRGVTQTCNEDIMECVKTYPDMVLYCLTVNSIHFDTHVSRAIRCRSHSASNVSLSWTEEVMGLEQCSFAASKICNCSSTCPMREETRIPQILQNPIHHQRKHQKPVFNNGNKNLVSPDHLHISTNQSKTYFLTKGMAENIRGIEFVYSKAHSLQFHFLIFYFFIFYLIFV